MDPKSKGDAAGTYYDANYGNFETELYSEIRRESFGDDIGQNSWLTAEEQDMFLGWLDLSAGKTLLDVACGSGGPALRIAASTGCSLVGIDLHEQAIATAKSLASQRNLKGSAEFCVVNASGQLPFPSARFDVITCIDGNQPSSQSAPGDCRVGALAEAWRTPALHRSRHSDRATDK